MSISGSSYVWGESAKGGPDEPGIYSFYNNEKVVIYIGGSENLRETFSNYLKTNFSEDSKKRETKYYKREKTSNWKKKVHELLEIHRNIYGKLPELNHEKKFSTKKVNSELGFYFYKDINDPIFENAFNLNEFYEKIRKVPIVSIKFHQKRGDLARWINDVFKETQLAERINSIQSDGEDLRAELLKTLENPDVSECPACEKEVKLIKKWNMAGKPSKNGTKLQLTIGFYKCNDCKKPFRKVLKKEKISTQ